MEAIYFDENNIKELNENGAFEKFNDYWGITKLCDSENTFSWNGKKYRFDRLHTTPCVLMKCLDDDSVLSFGVNSEIKEELVLL